MKFPLRISLLLIVVLFIAGWGSVGHKLVNTKTTSYFPVSMNYFKAWSADLGSHASDADNRKNSDATEGMKHYIDIDVYPEFLANGYITQDYNEFVTLHGSSMVTGNGIVPWAILRTVDSLKVAFQNRDWNKAILKAADLGHYVGDAHMPLHLSDNYDGKLTGQTGIHSRYETKMIGSYSGSIVYKPDTAHYVSDKSNYVFSFVYENFKYRDSVLNADLIAKSFDASYGSVYNAKLWELTGTFTTKLFNNASRRLADLIYTAWVDAGSPDPSISSANEKFISPADFYLYQNYPNPFNPVTVIKYQIPAASQVTLRIYDMLGKEISVPVNGFQQPGLHEVNFNGAGLTSGVYIYRIETSYYKASRKLLLLK